MNCFRMTAFRFSKIEISYCEVFYCEKSRCLKIWNLPIYVQLNVRWFIWCVFLYEDLNWQNVRCFLTSIWIFYVFQMKSAMHFEKVTFLRHWGHLFCCAWRDALRQTSQKRWPQGVVKIWKIKSVSNYKIINKNLSWGWAFPNCSLHSW